MNLHEVLIALAQEHLPIKGGGYSDLLTTDLIHKSIRSRSLMLVDQGKIIPQKIQVKGGDTYDLQDDWGLNDEEFFKGAEQRFEAYYFSVPNRHSCRTRPWFPAKNADGMTARELSVGIPRAVARYELEWWVMANAVNNRIAWNNNHWFWKSETMPLVITKQMI